MGVCPKSYTSFLLPESCAIGVCDPAALGSPVLSTAWFTCVFKPTTRVKRTIIFIIIIPTIQNTASARTLVCFGFHGYIVRIIIAILVSIANIWLEPVWSLKMIDFLRTSVLSAWYVQHPIFPMYSTPRHVGIFGYFKPELLIICCPIRRPCCRQSYVSHVFQ